MLQRLFGLLMLSVLLMLTACDKGDKGGDKRSEFIAGGIRQLNSNERAADFDQLLQLFKTYYGPYELKEQTLHISIEKLATDLKAQAQNTKTDEEFMGYIMQFGAALQDGHVQFQIENTSSGVSRYRIPILLAPFEEKAIVADIDAELASFSGISVGDEILSVDAKTPFEILNSALKYRRTARSLTDQSFLLPVTFSRRSYMTDLLPKNPFAEVKFKSASGASQTINLPWTLDKYSANLDKILRPVAAPNSSVPALDLSVPYVNDYNTQIDSHVGQMGQVDPFFVTPKSQKKFGFVKAYPSDASRKKFGLGDKDTPPIFAALYKFQGKTILLVRQATYSPSDFKTGIYMKAYMALLSEYENLADVLVLDQTHNPGGSYCADFYNLFAQEGDVQSVEKVRADRKWINDLYVNWPASGDNPWDTKTLLGWGALVEKAYDQGQFLSEPFALFGGSSYVTPQAYTWTKPMLVLIDELAGSCGDMFPMLVKANKHVKLFGQNTMGLGGNVEKVGQLNNSRISISMTRGLFFAFRANGAYVPEDLVENNGVAPDIEYAHTTQDFRNGYVDYVKTFSQKVIEQIK